MLTQWNFPLRTHRPIFYHSFLDELCADLVGSPYKLPHSSKIMISPMASLLPATKIPKGLTSNAPFLNTEKLLWVKDQATGISWPYWIRSHFQDICFYLFTKGHTPQEIGLEYDPKRLKTLIEAGIITTNEILLERQKKWKMIEDKAVKSFKEKGVAHLPELIHPYLNYSLAHFYRCMIAEGNFPYDDIQVAKRFYGREEAMANFLHHQLTPLISRITNKKLWPTYSYYSNYQKGAVLEKHLDKPAAEISVTIALDYGAKVNSKNVWPLYVETDHQKISLKLLPGDAGMFTGIKLPHYREELKNLPFASVILLHYASKPIKSGPY